MTPAFLRPVGCLSVIAAALVSCATGAGAQDPRPRAGDLHSAPVFYERYHDTVLPVGDELELLREGRVRLRHYPPVDVTNFDWDSDSFVEYTWRMQMQSLRFLLPAIASDSEDDRRLARAWFMRWYAAHMVPEPAVAHWGEPMTVAYRAMVLVWLLKVEEERSDPDLAVVECLRASILAHQRDLVRPSRFSDLSNPGFMAALGLFETTRVDADSSVAALAVTRLSAMMSRAVSPAGVEQEQSAGYHFVVMNWLEQMAGYFGSLPDPPRDLVSRLTEVVTAMRRAGYFLQDHAGRMVPIGDTDSLFADVYWPAHRVREPEDGATTLFDPESGVAIYKGVAGRGDCRYLVFRIPGEHVEMRSHLHGDALAVFFSHGGETILGDAGRHSYSSLPERKFVTSSRAHNTVVSHPLPTTEELLPAFDVAAISGASVTGWSASMRLGPSTCTRFVRIPETTSAIQVVDSIVPLRPGARDSGELVVLWNLGIDVTRVTPGRAGEGGEYEWSLATRNGQRVRLTMRARGPGKAGIVDAAVVRGQREPLLGWYSPAQGVLRPVSTIVIRVRRDPVVAVTTTVEVERGACGAPLPGSTVR